MSNQDYNNWLLYWSNITTIIQFVPIIVLMWKYRTIPLTIKIIGWYLIAIISSNLLEQALYWSFNKHYYIFWKPILNKLQIYDTNFLNIIGRLIDYIFVGWIFSFAITGSLGKILKKVSWGLIPVAILVYFFIDGFRTYGTFNSILNRSYLIVVPALYFWYLFRSMPNVSLWQNPFFLFGLGLFVPNLFGLIMSFMGDKLNETDYAAFVKISIFRNVLTILSQFIFIYTFYQAKYTKYVVASKVK